MGSVGDESIGAREHGFKEYGAERLLASSVDFGWSGLSAELRAHGRGVITKSTKPETEVCVAISPSNSLVTRLIGGVVDRTMRGMLTAMQPLGRMGVTHDVVDAVVYLEQAPFITGEILRVDGAAFSGGGAW
jgi:AraC family transcriptional regulator